MPAESALAELAAPDAETPAREAVAVLLAVEEGEA